MKVLLGVTDGVCVGDRVLDGEGVRLGVVGVCVGVGVRDLVTEALADTGVKHLEHCVDWMSVLEQDPSTPQMVV